MQTMYIKMQGLQDYLKCPPTSPRDKIAMYVSVTVDNHVTGVVHPCSTGVVRECVNTGNVTWVHITVVSIHNVNKSGPRNMPPDSVQCHLFSSKINKNKSCQRHRCIP